MSKHTETGAGKGNGLHPRTTYDPDELADKVVESITTGSPISRSTARVPMTIADRYTLQRFAQESAEQFNERVALKLRTIGDKVLAKIEQKLDSDEFKTSELAFVYSVAHDKRLSLDGSRALQQSAVNVLVVAPPSKSELLQDLDGLKRVSSPQEST